MQSNCNGKLQSRSTADIKFCERTTETFAIPWFQSVASSVPNLPLNISDGREFSLGSIVDHIAFILTDGYCYNVLIIISILHSYVSRWQILFLFGISVPGFDVMPRYSNQPVQ